METSASVNKFKIRNRTATRKSGTEASTEKHVTTAKDNQDEGGYKVRKFSPVDRRTNKSCIIYLYGTGSGEVQFKPYYK